ncbi:YidH family protein [Plantactinospora sp. GCM10030261]|uniref:YidH family protein n=1 Tax=Plantactinospora sp. GCM10030261 TaxID=3273420 RepID=UPI003622BC39
MWRTIRSWFHPRELREVGTTPDYRFSLANERTFLAWLRTGLALIAGGLAVAQFLPRLSTPQVREALAVGLLALGALVAVRAVDHWARTERAIRLGEELPASRFPAVLALMVGVGAILLIVAVLTGAIRGR